MICAFTFRSKSSWFTALTEPRVPTGIKMGVSMAPWSVVSRPQRALVFFDVFNSLNTAINRLDEKYGTKIQAKDRKDYT